MLATKKNPPYKLSSNQSKQVLWSYTKYMLYLQLRISIYICVRGFVNWCHIMT